MKALFLWLIRWYRTCVSPYKGGAVCRFTPSCSQYAYTAIERFGAFKGGFMALWRILRCNPFSRGGYDPVPEKKPKQKAKSESALSDFEGKEGKEETP